MTRPGRSGSTRGRPISTTSSTAVTPRSRSRACGCLLAAALRRERQSCFLFPELGQSSRRRYFATGVPTGWVDLVLANPEVDSCQKEEQSSAQDSRAIGRRRN
jgi:hypothetical protein